MTNKIPMYCMDCDSDVLFDQVDSNVYQFTIAHDDTCPWYAQHQQELQQ